MPLLGRKTFLTRGLWPFTPDMEAYAGAGGWRREAGWGWRLSRAGRPPSPRETLQTVCGSCTQSPGQRLSAPQRGPGHFRFCPFFIPCKATGLTPLGAVLLLLLRNPLGTCPRGEVLIRGSSERVPLCELLPHI